MAGAGQRFILPNQFTVDASGPRVGAQLFFYATGTTSYQDTYSDSALSVPNVNPVVADANGQFGNVFLLGSPAYHVVLQDASGATIWDMDPVGPEITSTGQVPVGAMMEFGGPTAPNGWVLCYGQAISRTTYSALFAVLGTTFGAGDGSTTFNVPDRRGRVSVGQDNMGGTAANRVTQAGSGINAINVGAVGGDQILQGHTHTVIDPGHTHVAVSNGGTASILVGYGVNNSGQNTGYGFTIPIFQGYETIALGSGSVTIDSAVTGITLRSAGTGAGQNMPPAIVFPVIIYTGVGG